jgi:hypothetical protein
MLSASLRRILIASGFTIATSFMTVLSPAAAIETASSTTSFTGTIDPSCAVSSGFIGGISYVPTDYTDSGKGASKLETMDMVSFNCNSDTVNVSAAVTTTTPTPPSNATSLVGSHTASVTNTVNTGQNTYQAGDGTATGTGWHTDTEGNIQLAVVSTWTSNGEELLAGGYEANVQVTVTPN